MKSMAFYNNKGGVGKTTSAINVAYELSLDNSVLVIDLDGQSNCSKFFADEPKPGLEKVLLQTNISPAVAKCETRYPNIEIITSTPALNAAAAEFQSLSKKERLNCADNIVNFSKKPWYAKEYDYVLVDLPPALNGVTESVISVCDYVFVPIELGTFAIHGIPTITNIIADCGAKLGAASAFGGCFVNKFDRENPADIGLLELLKETLDNKVLKTTIPFSRVIKNSISYRLTAAEYMKWEYAAECCANLTKEIIGICGERDGK